MGEIQWNRFEKTVDGKLLKVAWWAKDFSIVYESKFGIMKYGLHLMYMIPKTYTEEEVQKWADGTAKLFTKCENYLNNPEFMEKAKSAVEEVELKKQESDKKLEELAAKKSELKKEFKAGKYNEKEYQKKLEGIKNQKWEIENHLKNLENKKIEELLDDSFEVRNIVKHCLFK